MTRVGRGLAIYAEELQRDHKRYLETKFNDIQTAMHINLDIHV